MIASLIVLMCLVADDASTREAYLAARAQAGRDADSQVRLALWCEAQDLMPERIEHLARALAIDPTHAAARRLLGMMDDDGRWRKPEDAARRLQEDADRTARLAEYAERRDRAPRTADGQWNLAIWCEQNGLKDEAIAHLTSVVRHDPSREAAWKRLGCKKVDGRWMNDDQIAATKAETQAQKAADKAWKARLQDIKADLKNPKKRADAETALAAISDPRAVPSLMRAFGGEPRRLVQILGQIDSPSASRALAMISIDATDPETRRVATETLRQRDPREFAQFLIGMLRDEVSYEVRHVGGPGAPGALFVEGERFNVQRLYSPPPTPQIRTFEGEPVWLDGDGYAVVKRFLGPTVDRQVESNNTRLNLEEFKAYRPDDPKVRAAVDAYRPTMEADLLNLRKPGTNNLAAYKFNPDFYLKNIVGINITDTVTTTTPTAVEAVVPIGRIEAEYRQAAVSAQVQLERDIAYLDRFNAEVSRTNALVLAALRGASSVDFGKDREAWKTWHIAQMGYSYTSRPRKPVPTVVQDVPLAYSPQVVPVYTQISQAGMPVQTRDVEVKATSNIMSCFGAGTLVHTSTGPRPIETLKVGDRVLSQSEENGLLQYRPIVTVLHNPPAPTLRVDLDGEAIISSTFHRFWVAGKGWKMARDLKPGDIVRTLDSTASVLAIKPDAVQPVFNLEIAGSPTFFVGKQAALVHDNTVPDLRATPFDNVPKLIASKP